jgi:hypothetical protein
VKLAANTVVDIYPCWDENPHCGDGPAWISDPADGGRWIRGKMTHTDPSGASPVRGGFVITVIDDQGREFAPTYGDIFEQFEYLYDRLDVDMRPWRDAVYEVCRGGDPEDFGAELPNGNQGAMNRPGNPGDSRSLI